MNKNLIIITILFLLTLITLSCNKSDSSIDDYRDKYLGDFNFTVNKHIFNFNDSTFFDTVIFFCGQITKTDKSQPSNSIVVNYLPSVSLPFAVNQSGKLDKPIGAPLAPSWSGQFESTNKLTFQYYLYGANQLVTGNRR